MASASYDLVVIGSGPGGYVAAIRASQLGLKVGVVEKAELGGICLNWGCIPTKALLKSAQVFEYIQHAKDYGITVGDAAADFGAVVGRSRNVANGMSKGIQFLFRKNKIDHIAGYGKLSGKGKIEVTAADDSKLSLIHISEPTETLPSMARRSSVTGRPWYWKACPRAWW